jgi:uncharacterized protein (TIGR02145 family)
MTKKLLLVIGLGIIVSLVSAQVTDIEGNEYKIVKIGDQVWSSDNLKVTKFANGDEIKYVKKEKDWWECYKKKTPAYCFYEHNEENKKRIGVLYNFYAVSDPRGLAPEGYRIATDEDWMTLELFVGMDPEEVKKFRHSRGKTEGKELMSSYPNECSVGLGMNPHDFSANLGGLRGSHLDGGASYNFENFGKKGFYWTTSTHEGSGIGRVFNCDGTIGRKTYNSQNGGYLRIIRE